MADVSETGAGTVGVEVASMAIVAVATVGAVQARAVHEHVIGLMVTAMVAVDPPLAPQSARVVLIVKVSEMVDSMSLPYYEGSIVRVLEPSVEESVIAAQVVMTLLLLSLIS